MLLIDVIVKQVIKSTDNKLLQNNLLIDIYIYT